MLTADVVAPNSVPSQRQAPAAENAAPRVDRERRFHHLFDVNLHLFDSVDVAAETALAEAAGSAQGVGVFTCNVDHVMMMKKSADFRAAYGRADIVTIDGAPLALLSKWTGTAHASRVTGVDLSAALVARSAFEGLRVALAGGAPGRGDDAARRLQEMHPDLPAPLVDSPRMGFELGDEEDMRLVARLQAFQPHVVIVCLGAPKQEFWIDAHRAELPGAVLVGAGATIDFFSGHQPRAPRVFQATGTEAFYRLATDFRRLWRRYLLRDSRFLALCPGVVIKSRVMKARRRVSNGAHPVVLGANFAWQPVHSGSRPCGACSSRAAVQSAA